MATHFRWYGSNTTVTVPFNAVYTYPSQANKSVKSTPRLPPKNGGTFTPGQEIRIEIPAMGYINGSHTTLSFDVNLKYKPVSGDASIIRFQNNIQSIFDRVSIMYGSTPIEDIPRYNQIVRSMTEWTTTGDFDQGSINDGIGHGALGHSGYVANGTAWEFDDRRTLTRPQKVNSRQAYIQGMSFQKASTNDRQTDLSGDGFGLVPATDIDLTDSADGVVTIRDIVVTRRYVIQLNLGLMLQGKLIPAKYMASQLAITMRLAQPQECIYWQQGYQLTATATNSGTQMSAVSTKFQTLPTLYPTFDVTNINLIPEILEFDSSYDATFLKGLQQGVPILFSSFNTFQFSGNTGATVTLAIPERNRSVKSVFTLQRRLTAQLTTDSGATFYTTGYPTDFTAETENGVKDYSSTLQDYQYRIGGRYFPASPVQCSSAGATLSNGGAEAYLELAKALGTVGDFRLSTPCNVLTWATPLGVCHNYEGLKKRLLPEYDGTYDVICQLRGGLQVLVQVESPGTKADAVNYSDDPNESTNDANAAYVGRSGCGVNSCCFAMAINLETSNGMEISGLNAEEQSDISIIMRWSAPQDPLMEYLVFTYYDAMLVLFENNVVQLIK